MSTSNLRIPRTLNHFLRIVRDSVFGYVRGALAEAGVQVVQRMYDFASRELVTCVLVLFLLCSRFPSTERLIGMAIADGDYPRARDRVVRIAQLVGRYVALLVAIRVLGKMKVCFFILLTRSVC